MFYWSASAWTGKWAVLYMWVRVYTISRLDFETVPTIQYFMFWQYSILCSDNTVFYVLTIQYYMFRKYSILCSDNTVFYVLTIQYFMFRKYSILCSDNTVFYVLTIQYFMFFISLINIMHWYENWSISSCWIKITNTKGL
jgi:hypothetical protein